jgi:hypothetical protein
MIGGEVMKDLSEGLYSPIGNVVTIMRVEEIHQLTAV